LMLMDVYILNFTISFKNLCSPSTNSSNIVLPILVSEMNEVK
jgi:hypothetical protein